MIKRQVLDSIDQAIHLGDRVRVPNGDIGTVSHIYLKDGEDRVRVAFRGEDGDLAIDPSDIVVIQNAR